ncbi:MAG TPA: DNA polymerase/3'-5' exonuclease PolX [Gemmatimonadaceae bacterium]|nr:DNA polymerase/3'-5' exonuclease PolX [Gemmatimonadaceae bacterium]
MDARTAAHALSQIAAYLELAGENRFKVKAYQTAARSLLALGVDDLGPMLRSGELAQVRGIGKATLAVVQELAEAGESSYLEQLRAQMPEGLLELTRVPGLSTEKIHKLHSELGIVSLDDLERAASEGRLAKVKGVGPRTAQRILAGITLMRESGRQLLWHQAMAEARGLLAAVRAHPDVITAEIAGSIRRRVEVVSDVDIVAAVRAAPEEVSASFASISGIRKATTDGGRVSLVYVDGSKMDLFCVLPARFGVALWRATGSATHVEAVTRHAVDHGFRIEHDAVVDENARMLPTPDEESFYRALRLPWIPPELREGMGEVAAASRHALPRLVELSDVTGVLHCHSEYSDGKHSISEMAQAAQAKGWEYIGISDHSQAAFYAGGLTPERVREQHDEIDACNAAGKGARVLKGIEADILADGRIDYDAALLDSFDYVIASIHGRFKMDGPAITERVLRAMDDPHMTILAHPTGRLLLSREPYALDVEAVLQKAAQAGVAIEINCDPHRMDLDWRYLHRARELGVTIEIGPDAHSRGSLDWVDLGVGLARKGGLEAGTILNTRSADDIVRFAKARRT